MPLNLFAQRRDAIERPRLADRNVEERANDPTHGGNLPDIRE